METKTFKKSFIEIAKRNNFIYESKAMFKESNDSIIALILRKSNYSKLFYLRIKLNLKTNSSEILNRQEWIKHDVADTLLGINKKFDALFDLENQINDIERLKGLEDLFTSELNDLTEKGLHKAGLIELYNSKKIILFPAAKQILGID